MAKCTRIPPEHEKSNPSSSSSTAASITGDVDRLRTLDNKTASSMFEYILRQRWIHDCVVNAVFIALPLADPLSPRLKKAIFLRRMASDLTLRSLSEETLTILELIEELDREHGRTPPPNSIKAAYCAVARYCTEAALGQNSIDFLDSYCRIWVLRIGDLQKSAAAAALMSDGLREARDAFRKLVDDPKRAPPLIADLTDTLNLVRHYLEEAWDMPPLLPLPVHDDDSSTEQATYSRANGPPDAAEGRPSSRGCQTHNPWKRLLKERGILQSSDVSILLQRIEQELSLKEKNDHAKKKKRAQHARETEFTRLDATHDANNTTLLALNCEETACTGELTTEGDDNDDGRMQKQEFSVCMLNKFSESPCLIEIEESQSEELENASPAAQQGNSAPISHLKMPASPIASIEKTSAIHDTIELANQPPPRERRYHLRSPKRPVSPLKPVDDGKRYTKRRKMRKWSTLEEDTLLEAVRQYGKGNWKFILSNCNAIFEQRTEIDLKDKWRNMSKK